MKHAVVLIAAIFLGGCSPPLATAIALHNAGNLEGAARDVQTPEARKVMAKDDRDHLLTLMEGGKILQDGDALADSIDILYQASRVSEHFATLNNRPSAAELVGSAVVNPTVRTYRGTYSERIRIEAYQVLNQLLVGNIREAAVYARRTGERQTDAQVLQAKELAAASQDAKSWRGGEAEGHVQSILQSKELTELVGDAGYAAYLDPFASWIAGIAWCATGNGQEFQEGASNIQETLQMMPTNTWLQKQVQQNPFASARPAPGQAQFQEPAQGQVFILFETGIAPSYKQITIPLFTPWTGVSTIPIQVPEYSHPAVTNLDVRDSAGTQLGIPEMLADYNQIFGAQYKRMEPDIIFGTLVMVAVKEGATVGGYLATQNSSAAQIGILAAASLYKVLTNQADLRTWHTPGAHVLMAQVPRPADGILQLSLTGSTPPATQRIDLPSGLITLIYVRSVVPGQVRCTVAPIWGTEPPAGTL